MTKDKVIDTETDDLIVDEETDDLNEDETKSQTPSDPIEDQARAMGWRPEAEYEGDDWIPAKEFVQRKPLYDRMKSQGKTIKRLEKQVNELLNLNEKVGEASYKQAKADLLAARKQAVEQEDLRAYDNVTQQLEELEASKPSKVKQNGNEIFDEWMESNTWYTTDKRKRTYADGVSARLRSENPDIPISDLLEQVSQEVEEFFEVSMPTPKVTRPARKRGEGGRGSKAKITYADLPPEAQAAFHYMVKSATNPNGVMSAEKYLEQYALIAEQEKK